MKDFGSLRAVKDVTFSLNPGEIFGLLGPNGAGKTTLISTVVTLEQPTSGQIEVFGYDVNKNPRQAKALVGYVPQELINHGYFNVLEVLKFYSGFFGVRPAKDYVEYLLGRLGLWEHRFKRVKQLSGGMKRRLLIAKALLHEPKLLLLDEPTAGVDIELRSGLWDFVRELQKEGLTILLTTHYLEEAEKLCDRVGIIHHGELKRVSQTEELIADLTSREISLNLKTALSDIDHPTLVHQQGERLVFRVPAAQSVGDLLADLQLDLRHITDMKIVEGNLEDAFRRVLGGGKS